MKATPLVALSLVSVFFLCVAAQSNTQEKSQKRAPAQITMKVWNIEDVLAKHRKSKRSYTGFFRVPSTRCGVYTLPKGAKDGQTPHKEDELYYVVRGKAKMDSDGKKVDLKPGSLVFIAADAEHKFIDIEEDLELLVVFSSGQKQKPPKK